MTSGGGKEDEMNDNDDESRYEKTQDKANAAAAAAEMRDIKDDDTQQQEGARNALVWPDILTKTHDIGGPKKEFFPSEELQEKAEKKNSILVLDGGGLRGLISACVLERVEKWLEWQKGGFLLDDAFLCSYFCGETLSPTTRANY